MQMTTRENLAVAMTALLTLTTVVPVRAQAPAEPSPNAGIFSYSGGPATAKRARTQTALTNFSVINVWHSLPGATLSFVVPVETTDLFNIAFSAECAKVDGGQLLIRIHHMKDGVAQPPVEPYDGGQSFCQSSPATHKGNWVRRVGAGN